MLYCVIDKSNGVVIGMLHNKLDALDLYLEWSDSEIDVMLIEFTEEEYKQYFKRLLEKLRG